MVKALLIAVCILVFNIFLSGMTNSGMFEISPYYDNELIDTYNESLPGNFSSIDEAEAYQISTNAFGVILNTISFGWIQQFIPENLHDNLAWLILGLNAFGLFISSVALIELFFKRSIF